MQHETSPSGCIELVPRMPVSFEEPFAKVRLEISCLANSSSELARSLSSFATGASTTTSDVVLVEVEVTLVFAIEEVLVEDGVKVGVDDPVEEVLVDVAVKVVLVDVVEEVLVEVVDPVEVLVEDNVEEAVFDWEEEELEVTVKKAVPEVVIVEVDEPLYTSEVLSTSQYHRSSSSPCELYPPNM